MDSKNIIKGKLDGIADANYESNATHFKDKEQFKMAIELCYSFVANKTCRQWNDVNGLDCQLDSDITATNFSILFYGIEHTPIHSNDFKRLLGSFRLHGKKTRFPYGIVLKALEDGGIIEINSSYSSGKDANGNEICSAYPKSYRMDSRFMFKVISIPFSCKKIEIQCCN